MRNERNDRLEDFIQDWYWDEPSHEFARKLGRFLLQFLDHINEEGLSRKTINVHSRNGWCICKFECDYGNTTRFSYRRMFSSPAAIHVYWFEQKCTARSLRWVRTGQPGGDCTNIL